MEHILFFIVLAIIPHFIYKALKYRVNFFPHLILPLLACMLLANLTLWVIVGVSSQ